MKIISVVGARPNFMKIAPVELSAQKKPLPNLNPGFLPKPGSSFLQSLCHFLITKELLPGYKEYSVVHGFVSFKLWFN
jgi:hypothetical protein